MQLQLLYYQLKNYDNTKNYLKDTYPKNITRLIDNCQQIHHQHISVMRQVVYYTKLHSLLDLKIYRYHRCLQIHNTQKYIQK
jgi:hypothetical protein